MMSDIFIYNNLMKFKNAQIIYIYVNPRSIIKMSRHVLENHYKISSSVIPLYTPDTLTQFFHIKLNEQTRYQGVGLSKFINLLTK